MDRLPPVWFKEAWERAWAVTCVTIVLVAFVVTNPMMPGFRQYRVGSPAPQAVVGACPSLVVNAPDGPDPWGGCWPGPLSTGIAGCPALAPVTGNVTISLSGTTYENKHISDGKLMFATGVENVTVRCVKVSAQEFFPVDLDRNLPFDSNDILLDHVEVDCQRASGNNGAFLLFGATVTNSRSMNCVDQFRFGINTVIEDNYCSDQGVEPGSNPHYDCAFTGGLASNVTIRHNTLDGTDTSDIGVGGQEGPTSDILIDRNLLMGHFVESVVQELPGYLVHVGRQPTEGALTNIAVTDNRFNEGDYGFGPCTVYGPDTPTWTGNVYNQSGLPLPITDC